MHAESADGGVPDGIARESEEEEEFDEDAEPDVDVCAVTVCAFDDDAGAEGGATFSRLLLLCTLFFRLLLPIT